MAMYFLVWSPTLWQHIDLSKHNIAAEFLPKYEEEKITIEQFVSGLKQVRRVLGPVYMIYDDHDVTDDWSLTRG